MNYRPFDLLRITIAIILCVHGIARIYLNIVDDFGVFLDNEGFVFGVFLAWMITILEIVGSMLLIFNILTFWICLYFIIQLLMGILLVHLSAGWFVVGAGRNGMEYSVLLIVVLISIALNNKLNTSKLAPDRDQVDKN